MRNLHGCKTCVFLYSEWDNKSLVLSMQLCTFNMVSHPSSFRIISTN
jgi:hypothetical protein